MNRPEELDIVESRVQRLNCPADPSQWLSKRVTPVGCDQHEAFVRIELDTDR